MNSSIWISNLITICCTKINCQHIFIWIFLLLVLFFLLLFFTILLDCQVHIVPFPGLFLTHSILFYARFCSIHFVFCIFHFGAMNNFVALLNYQMHTLENNHLFVDLYTFLLLLCSFYLRIFFLLDIPNKIDQ